MTKKVVVTAIFLSLILLGLFVSLGEGSGTSWNKAYAIPGDNQAKCVVQTGDGGYIIAGFANSSEGYKARVIKTDELGNVQWDKQYGGVRDYKAFSIIQTNDGNFAFAGGADGTGDSFNNAWLVKIDSAGSVLWQQTYSQAGQANSLFQTGDGGYAIGAAYQLIKVDNTGKTLWSKQFDQTINDVAQTQDGGYVIAGDGYWTNGNGWQAYIVKVDSSGNKQFNQTYLNSQNGWANSVIQASDGGFVFAGNILDQPNSHGGRDILVWLLKTDSSGNMQWDKKIHGLGENNGVSAAYSVIQTKDGGYALAGKTNPYALTSTSGYHGPYWLIKTDSAGSMQWNEMFQGNGSSNIPYSIIETSDGGYAIAGSVGNMYMGNGIFYSGDFWLVKTDQNGNTPGLSSTLPHSELSIQALSMIAILILIPILVVVFVLLMIRKRRRKAAGQSKNTQI